MGLEDWDLGLGTWDLGLGTWDLGLGDVGREDVGRGGTQGFLTAARTAGAAAVCKVGLEDWDLGLGTRGLGDLAREDFRTRGRGTQGKDVLNKQHLTFSLN